MNRTLEDIIKNEKPEVCEAKWLADDMLKKIHDIDGDSAKTASDQQS